jgi:plastocyanin
MAVRARQLGPFAVRSTEILIAEGGEEHHTLKRAVGALDLTALGVGAIIGGARLRLLSVVPPRAEVFAPLAGRDAEEAFVARAREVFRRGLDEALAGLGDRVEATGELLEGDVVDALATLDRLGNRPAPRGVWGVSDPRPRRPSMRRRLPLFAAVLATALLAALLQVPAALAGGYCQTPATDGRGTTVTLEDYCYNPTVLRVPSGGQVTFVNADKVAHPTVGRGSDWFADVAAAGRATIRFDKPGIYPYFCHQHLGMIGVVVVGDGRGEAAAPVVVADPPAARPATAQASAPAAGAAAPWSLAGGVLLGLAVAGGALLALAARRRRARQPAHPAPEG